MSNKHFSKLLKSFAIFALTWTFLPSDAIAADVGKAYAVLAFDENEPRKLNHIVSFDYLGSEDASYQTVVPFSTTSTAGAYSADAYYIATSVVSGNVEVPAHLVKVDLEASTTNVIGALRNFSSLINDMTFDHSSQTMYMISVINDSESALFTVDLTTATTKKVAGLGRKFFTLACSNDGQLYGMSFYGDFCKIDKKTGEVTEIKKTGYYPEGFQTMTFDPSSGKIYWAAQVRKFNSSGTVQVDYSLLVEIDPATGETIERKSLDDAQLAGLYIPGFVTASTAPAAVKNLNLVPGVSGANTAVLSWVNPDKTYGGDLLKSISGVKILRDNEEIATLSGCTPGASQTYTDNLPASNVGAYHTYRVFAVRNQENGMPVEVSAYIGKDVPAAVTNIKVTKLSPSSAKVTWSPSVGGANGGWTDSQITYSVIRNPGNEKMATGLTDTEWIQEPVGISAAYTYSIIATNSCGSSEAVASESIALGPKWGMPFNNEFTADEFAQWSLYDSNNDSNKWSWFNLSWAKADGAYFMASNNAGDDWLVSREMEFDSNSTYKYNIKYVANGTHTVDLVLLKENDPSSEAILLSALNFEKVWEVTDLTGTFQIEDGGDYFLALHEKSPSGTSYLLIDALAIEKLAAHNLQATLISGTSTPIIGHSYNYTVTVTNRGSEDASGFTVSLLDNSDNVLGSVVYTETIAPGESAMIPVNITISEAAASLKSLIAKVDWSEDEITADNISAPLVITVMPLGTPEELQLGIKKGTSLYQPLNLYSGKYSATLDIYGAGEIGISAGRITGLRYDYSSTYSSPTGVGLQIYIANTDRTKANTGWIPKSEMTLVYDGKVNLVKGVETLAIDFDNSFNYDGRNLAILVVTNLDKASATYYSGIYFPYYDSPLAGNKAYCYPKGNTVSEPFKFTQEGGERSGSSVVTLVVQSGGACISGKVTDTAGNPFKGAEVTVEEINATSTTDATGAFNFDFIPNGTYTVTAKAFGYELERKENVVIDDDNADLSFSLVKIPVYNIRGKVIDAVGNAIAGANVNVDGYTQLSTLTSQDGSFSFTDVVSHETKLTVSKPWHVTVQATSDLTSEWNLGDVKMGYAHYSPTVPTVEESDTDLSLAWEGPDEFSTLRYDNGLAVSQFGLEAGLGTIVVGNVYRTPIELHKVSWMTTSEAGPHNTVNLYIYDLDEKGNPTGNVLYKERSIFNTDEEWTVHELPEPISAPHGCMIGINYPGFQAIAIDNASMEYPANESIVAYTLDYNGEGDFSYIGADIVGGNLMIRGEGYLYPSENDPIAVVGNDRGPLPSFQAYQVMRSANGTDWQTIVENTKDKHFVDSEWNSLPSGSYRYAVTSIYPDGTLSAKSLSRYILKNMDANIKVSVSTNSHSKSAKGASVILAGENEDIQEATVGDEGYVEFKNVFKQNYDLNLILPGYEPIETNLAVSGEGKNFNYEYVMKEIIATPVNIEFKGDENQGYDVSWNESGEVFDGFENHVPFTVASPGEIGWQYIDGDRSRTFAESDFKFPGITQPMSMMAFFPKLTEPSIYDAREASHPHNGNAELACFAGYSGSNDWFISPRLNYHSDFTFSFWARGYSQTYGEKIRIGYSTTTPEPSSFNWLTEVIDVPKQIWTEYSFTVPSNARYVTINAVSPDGFILFIDDVKISSGKGFKANTAVSGPEVKYEILLDNEVILTTEETQMHIDPLGSKDSKLGLRASYASGLSDIVDLLGGAGIDDVIVENKIAVSPNPANDYTVVNTEFNKATLFSLSGQLIASYKNVDRVIHLDKVPKGLYLLVIEAVSGQKATVKLQVK